MSEKPISHKAPMFAWMVPRIQEIARKHGYAIGLHGSMNRDLDLMAVPWVDPADSPEALIEDIRLDIGGMIIEDGTPGGRWSEEKGEFIAAVVEQPSRKPHGRLAWNIHLDGGICLDISVMPCRPSPGGAP
jgi:hypothetical protein